MFKFCIAKRPVFQCHYFSCNSCLNSLRCGHACSKFSLWSPPVGLQPADIQVAPALTTVPQITWAIYPLNVIIIRYKSPFQGGLITPSRIAFDLIYSQVIYHEAFYTHESRINAAPINPSINHLTNQLISNSMDLKEHHAHTRNMKLSIKSINLLYAMFVTCYVKKKIVYPQSGLLIQTKTIGALSIFAHCPYLRRVLFTYNTSKWDMYESRSRGLTVRRGGVDIFDWLALDPEREKNRAPLC